MVDKLAAKWGVSLSGKAGLCKITSFNVTEKMKQQTPLKYKTENTNMKKLSSREIRQIFLDFFSKNDHHKLAGASIIPDNNPTLLYINSGMAPLKNYFLGKATPPKKVLCNV